MKFHQHSRRLRVVFNGETVAESQRVTVLQESGYPPVFYFLQEDVRMDFLRRTAHATHCPFKGNATYWDVCVGEHRAENAVWSYQTPVDAARAVAGRLAFYPERMDAWYEDDQPMPLRPGEGGRSHPNPLVNWLLESAFAATTPEELVTQLVEQMLAAGIPLLRLNIVLVTLHPQVTGLSYKWLRGAGPVEEEPVPHSRLAKREYLDSPLYPIFEGAGGIRRRLEGDNPQLDFPILHELKAQGATDYVAMPLLFSDGRINVLTLSADQPGGFSTAQLGGIYEVLGLLSRLFEVHALRRTSVGLLNTYLGRQSGERVLNGQVKRGDGENIFAVIWFCDLRNSTPLADTMSREDFLGLLNKFFDAMGGAVLANGGEILRFIGDAALAIFPIGSSECRGGEGPDACQACENALAAVHEARARMAAVNTRRSERRRELLNFGLGLHLGEVTYGNIGTAERLEF
ncbi:MAG: guanylate cyclase, partial [Gammaproteobacteria bacterium]